MVKVNMDLRAYAKETRKAEEAIKTAGAIGIWAAATELVKDLKKIVRRATNTGRIGRVTGNLQEGYGRASNRFTPNGGRVYQARVRIGRRGDGLPKAPHWRLAQYGWTQRLARFKDKKTGQWRTSRVVLKTPKVIRGRGLYDNYLDKRVSIAYRVIERVFKSTLSEELRKIENG